MIRFPKSLALLAATALITGAASASYAGPPKKSSSGGPMSPRAMTKKSQTSPAASPKAGMEMKPFPYSLHDAQNELYKAGWGRSNPPKKSPPR